MVVDQRSRRPNWVTARSSSPAAICGVRQWQCGKAGEARRVVRDGCGQHVVGLAGVMEGGRWIELHLQAWRGQGQNLHVNAVPVHLRQAVFREITQPLPSPLSDVGPHSADVVSRGAARPQALWPEGFLQREAPHPVLRWFSYLMVFSAPGSHPAACQLMPPLTSDRWASTAWPKTTGRCCCQLRLDETKPSATTTASRPRLK